MIRFVNIRFCFQVTFKCRLGDLEIIGRLISKILLVKI